MKSARNCVSVRTMDVRREFVTAREMREILDSAREYLNALWKSVGCCYGCSGVAFLHCLYINLYCALTDWFLQLRFTIDCCLMWSVHWTISCYKWTGMVVSTLQKCFCWNLTDLWSCSVLFIKMHARGEGEFTWVTFVVVVFITILHLRKSS